jgi:hypothetical protein
MGEKFKALRPLPCPFCGAPARTYYYNGTTQAVCSKTYVECAGSQCDAPVAMWNRRAPSTARKSKKRDTSWDDVDAMPAAHPAPATGRGDGTS